MNYRARQQTDWAREGSQAKLNSCQHAQAEVPSGNQPGQIISTESSWPGGDRPSHADNAWAEPAAAFASSQAVSAPLQKAYKPAPAAAQPVAQVIPTVSVP